MVKPKYDLVGQKYNKLLVLSQADDAISPTGKKRSCWNCQCDCGRIVVVEGTNLKSGNSKSCGLCNRESHIKHGGRHTRIYSIWSNIKARCYDVNNKTYLSYGARGITMCDEWKNDFTKFREWAFDNGYSDSLSIDRIDNNAGYFPENCRWADPKVQANNRRSSKYVEIDGVQKSLAAWADDLGYSRSIFHARAKLYHTGIEEQVRILYHQSINSTIN